MAVIVELLLLTGLLTSLYTSDLSSAPEETSGGLVEKYENSKTLYDLIAHFPIDEDIKCPESDTRLPYPGDCTRYITCRDFKAHIRGCPPGFRFDKESLNCRFAFQVKCNNSVEVDHICGANELYSECGSTCEASCEDFSKKLVDCPEDCIKGCFCREGYVRGPLRVCVPKEKCKTSNNLEPWFLTNNQEKLETEYYEDEENFNVNWLL